MFRIIQMILVDTVCIFVCLYFVQYATYTTTLVVLLLQQNVPDRMRGREMGAWTFCIGMGPIGAMLIGYLAEIIGVQHAVGISGALLVLATLIVAVAVPVLRK